MSQHPDDLMDDAEDLPPAAGAEIEIGNVAIDLYRVVELAGPAEEPSGSKKPGGRSAREVWSECVGHLQDATVSLFELLAAIPQSAVKIVRSAGSLVENSADLVRRLFRGRRLGDHQEDQKIAEAEHSGPPAGHESQVQAESAMARLEAWMQVVRLQGATPRVIRTPEGKLIFSATAEECERTSIEATQAKLIEHNSTAAPSGPVVPIADPASIEPSELEKRGLGKRITRTLNEAGIFDLKSLLTSRPAAILALTGIGPKSFTEIRQFVLRNTSADKIAEVSAVWDIDTSKE
jgi:hypothetical protein